MNKKDAKKKHDEAKSRQSNHKVKAAVKSEHPAEKKDAKKKHSDVKILKTAEKSEKKTEKKQNTHEEQKQNLVEEQKEPAAPEMIETPVIEYKRTEFQFNSTTIIKLYEDGKVKYNKLYIKTSSNDDKEFSVPVKEVEFYADKLIQIGFLNFKKEYSSSNVISDNFYDSMTLNYKGNKKTVTCTNAEPESKQYSSLISDLINLKFENIKKYREIKLKRRKNIWTAVKLAVLALILLFLFLSIQPGTVMQRNETITVNRTITQNESAGISLAEFTGITDANYAKNVSLLAYLKKEEVPVNDRVSNVYQYVIDDDGNKLMLLINGLKKTREYEGLFADTVSVQTYRVTGILRNTYKGLVLEVDTIIPENKEITFNEGTVSETIVELKNTTTNRKLNLTFGFERAKDLLGFS